MPRKGVRIIKEQYVCYSCATTYDVTEKIWKCTCGGLLDLVKDETTFDISRLQEGPPTMWRYIDALPFKRNSTSWQAITLGEGYTPLIKLDHSEPNTFVKVDYMMPTLSFKDRGAAVLIAKAKEIGVTKVIADSSGNAGTSIAAYAARAGIACDVFLREGTSPKKIAQVKAHGANVRAIKGTREDVARAAQTAVNEENIFYASHVYNPFFYEGTKTYAYEIWEQLKCAPDALIIPVGNGTLLLGAYYGFMELLESGLIKKMPKLIAIQAENCAPLAKGFMSHGPFEPVENKGTIAEGIAIAAPARAVQILEKIRDTDGEIITTTEEEIIQARITLAGKGFYVEPTTAANYAGYLKYKHSPSERIIIPLCGAGIKSN
ncbi:pyridoxal-5'-phosphate-dependent protein subunit beta [Bacillus sp. FJAT-18017]|uniref:threonine synthase n=1 Tax=Bacillus sp. FJAT-18017 TaxID=1705566 RepID=UPI0006AE1BEA|nr:threonine synthase [Bacillus sp. FJAT-18017]ALC91555.1 pyridoxal-5'-phosphate-dependent protein subunit beta [Bacillus sp. FJAT-18017]